MSRKRRMIRNTEKDDVLLKMVVASVPNGWGIEAQEAAGQSQLVSSTQLPMVVCGRAELEALGIVFGPPCADDPIFCEALLPAGWKKLATDHSMWSELVDADGKVRASIFYKAAFYDRSAFMRYEGQNEATK